MKGGKTRIFTRINLYQKEIIDKRSVKKRWFMRSARLYPAEVQNFRFCRLPIADFQQVDF